MNKDKLDAAIAYFSDNLNKQKSSIVEKGFYGFYEDNEQKEDGKALACIYTALTALRDAQARQEGCEYCEDGFECDTNHFHTRPDWRLLNDINDCIPAHYCPNCGRHLASDQAKEGGE